MEKNIILIIDHEEGIISSHSRELAAAAMEVAVHEKRKIRAIMAGYETAGAAETFAAETGLNIVTLENDSLRKYSAEGYVNVITGYLKNLYPQMILAAHNPRGCDFAPALAMRLNYSSIGGVEGIAVNGREMSFIRTAWHGKIREEVILLGKPSVITIMPGAFSFSGNPGTGAGTVTRQRVEFRPEKTLSTGAVPSGIENAALSSADVVIAAGKGIKKPETMELVASLLDLFPRSALGGSRGACDAGLVDYSSQVGLTGKTVSPKLYIACGISGASQHTAGMKGSRTIVAVNNDPHAPFFSISHLGIVDDIENFLPAFLDVAKKHRVD